MYSDVVLGVHRDKMEELIAERKKEKGVKLDIELSADDWKELVGEFKAMVKKETGNDFPEDPDKQLWGAIGAVFESWNTPRAITYRQLNKIPEDWGTAVNVQTMVFGNMGGESATGVAFTRDPATGEKFFFGEFLPNAQGEDVVAGIRTPQPIGKDRKADPSLLSMEEMLPKPYGELEKIYQRLEKHFKDMQDIEFTIQQGKALDAPDPQRQADCLCRPADRRGDGGGKADRQEDGHLPHRPRFPEPASGADLRPPGQGRSHQGG